jgi:aminoglycoside phosphotransferase family enzyme/predicted kinase
MSVNVMAPSVDNALRERVEFLLRPSVYSEPTTKVEMRETHLSCVFLTDRHVYKLKKPVDLGFVDYRSLAARRAACEEELRLNRRLAAGVYLAVVPLVEEASGEWRLGGSGSAIEYLVKMRRLPEERMLDRLIAEGKVSDMDLALLTERLIPFYNQASPLLLMPEDYCTRLERHVSDNLRELLRGAHQLPAGSVVQPHAAQLVLLRTGTDVLSARVCDGRIIDGHGDLRPEHICLETPPAVYDCVEFSEELRQVDVLDELAFLAMECQRLGGAPVGHHVLRAYLARSGDRPAAELLWFYMTYRACVRAKVAVLRAAQQEGASAIAQRRLALEYLRLAGEYARRLMRPFVLVVRGLVGTGKTTLATALADALGIPHLSTDALRRQLLGPATSPAPYDGGRYTSQHRAAVYEQLFDDARRWLAVGVPVVLDGTFLSTAMVQQARELAEHWDAAIVVAECHCPQDEAARRIAQRLQTGASLSEARPEFYRRQLEEWEPVPSAVPTLRVDTMQPFPLQQKAVFDKLGAVVRTARGPLQPDDLA